MVSDVTSSSCPYRYLDRGRTFCAIAIVERQYTTAEVNPRSCGTCGIPELLRAHPCGHLSLGVEIDEYGGRFTADVYHAACEAFVESLESFERCGEGRCPHWQPLPPERLAAQREHVRQLRERARFRSLPRDEADEPPLTG